MQVSQPFLITITNTSKRKIQNVRFLDAISNAVKEADNYGLPKEIVATFGYPGLTYGQFLSYLISNSAQIMLLRTHSQNESNLKSAIRIDNYNLSGVGFNKTYHPHKHIFSTIDDIREINVNFHLIATLSITLEEIAPNSEITFELYPSKVSSLIANLERGREFKDPNVNNFPKLS